MEELAGGEEDRLRMESQEDVQELPAPEEMEEPAGKVRLILDKGWSIGKKIAITGVAISTAPILLPPLMIVSAFGLAFSVPFGLVFAGYACTNKIMRSLLTPPPATDAVAAAAASASASPEEEVCMKALSEETKEEGIPGHEDEIEELEKAEVYEDGAEEEGEVEGKGVSRSEKEEVVREMPEDNERNGVREPPKDDREEGLKVQAEEENVRGIARGDTAAVDVGDANREEKGQEAEEIVKEINKADDRSRLVVCETRKAEDAPEADNKIKRDAGEKKMEEVREGDNKVKQDAGDIKKEEKERQGKEVSVKEISEADDYGVPSVAIVSTLKEETEVPNTDTPGTDDIDVGTDSSDVRQLEKSSMPTKVTPLNEKSFHHDMESAQHFETFSKPDSRAASGKQQLETPAVEVSSLVSVNTLLDF